ncbi:hypothetical protein [Paenibacillus abyssi]|uniref:Uncharacterized protein n=1 Tax=Paenibacillus abyssi TaxID=1340531 RepID=A0A917G1B7_9BACL|nr:hypothetical protein [Paenibacillus abyssi]GGG18009.1 hypothetical protein GCM10010916_38480 [Paenibacillus abyssi]
MWGVKSLDFNMALKTAINHLQTRNYSMKELGNHLTNLDTSILGVFNVANQQKETSYRPIEQIYEKAFQPIFKSPNQFIKSRGEGALLSLLSTLYFAFNTELDNDLLQQIVGAQLIGRFADLYQNMPQLDLTQKCLLATLPRTWLEFLFMGLSDDYPKMSTISRLVYKDLRSQADREFTSFRFDDQEKLRSVINTPLICLTQLFNTFAPAADEESFSGLAHKIRLEEIKSHGVIFKGNKFAIGNQIFEVPPEYIPVLAKHA